MDFSVCSYLPDEIILNILLLLPAKSIGRCRCVSKQWRVILSSPQFIKTHLTHIKKLPQKSLSLITNPPFLSCLILTHAHQLFDEITASVRRLSFAAYTDVICSCDGLMLVMDDKDHKFLINPTTHETREVPTSPFSVNPAPSDIIYGLGYDQVNDDYKIVALSYYYSEYDELLPTNMLVHVYSVNNGTWKKCESSPYDFDLYIDYRTSGVFVERCIHWLARRTTDYSSVVVVFDLVEEKFYEMAPYNSIDDEKNWFHYLKELGGRLCICSNRFDLWMMTEYGVEKSWTKSVTFDSEGGEFRPVYLLGQNSLILQKLEENFICGKLVGYNLKEKRLKNVVVHGIGGNIFTLWGTFMETLVSLHQ